MHVNIVVYFSNTTIKFYNEFDVKMKRTPEFYTGAPVDPVDLRFREEFLAELWETLRTKHLVLTAARRTGKTSVMDHLREHPMNGFSVVSSNAQDLTHPGDFFQVLLDAFHDAHPSLVRDKLAAGWELVSDALGKGRGDRCRWLQTCAAQKRSQLARKLAAAWRHVSQTGSQNRKSRFYSSSTSCLTCCSTCPGRMQRCCVSFSLGFEPSDLNPAPARDSIRWLAWRLSQSRRNT